jgi:antitoxin component HigA of HigAB toxin-antitoxin module
MVKLSWKPLKKKYEESLTRLSPKRKKKRVPSKKLHITPNGAIYTITSNKMDAPEPITLMREYTKEGFASVVKQYIDIQVDKDPENPKVILSDFCVFAGVSKRYLQKKYLMNGSKDDFSDAIDFLMTYGERYLETNGLESKTNFNMTSLTLKNNFGWKEKTETITKTEIHHTVEQIKSLSTEELLALVEASES